MTQSVMNEFDPWSPAFVASPYAAYQQLRETAPVTWYEPTQQWLISRYADVSALLRDRRLGRSEDRDGIVERRRVVAVPGVDPEPIVGRRVSTFRRFDRRPFDRRVRHRRLFGGQRPRQLAHRLVLEEMSRLQ